ncbi:MAG: bifunctional metallophosphatase/5'-nucleotidase [Chitinophagales bacterium]
MKRREFIKKSLMAGVALGATQLPLPAFAKNDDDFFKLTILHTNDTHSRIEPFPEGSKYAGLGGMAKRADLVNKIREEEEHILLLDAGDIFQGTPYFNVYEGELEFQLMSEMGYDATTLGNHDFDAGIDGLVKQLPHATFPFLNCNYDFAGTELEGKVEPYKIFQKGEIKIGVFGVGIELDGLVPDALFGDIKYNDPIENANKTAFLLKNDEKCDLVICLSHLGLEYESEKISDVVLAEKSENVDIVIGGHTHTFLDKPMVINNLNNQPVVINQVGWAGIVLGRLDVHIDTNKKKKEEKTAPVFFSEKTIVN